MMQALCTCWNLDQNCFSNVVYFESEALETFDDWDLYLFFPEKKVGLKCHIKPCLIKKVDIFVNINYNCK